jgi:hypothetical protein
MRMNRRAALRAGCLGAGAVLAGCLGGDGERVPTESPPISVLTVTDSETVGFAVRGAVGWEGTGYVVVVDSEERQRSLLTKYGIPNDRRDRVLGFLDGIDYASERLVLVESVGPDSCHDELEIGDVGVDDEGIRATATVGRESDADEGCREVLTYPSSLLRVAFEGEPPDRAVVDVTDGRDASSSVAASVEDSLSPAPEDLPGRVRPDDEPDPVAPLSCDRAGVERHDQWFDEDDRQWGDYDDGGTTTLALRVDDLTYDRGDTLNASLTNVAEEPVETGNSSKYNIQVLTEEGWQDLRVIDAAESFAYTDEAVSHGPGEGFDWSIELTEEGIIGSSVQEDAEVCPDLQSGRHRLAYFGVDDGAVAVGFELEM